MREGPCDSRGWMLKENRGLSGCDENTHPPEIPSYDIYNDIKD